MPDTRECGFCGGDIEPGTGTLFVRTNGATVQFCSAKCEKNADLGREARDLNWTEAGRESDRQETAAAGRQSTQSTADEEASTEADDAGATPDLDAAEAEAETGDEAGTTDDDEETGDEAETTDDDEDEPDDSDTEAEEAEA